MFYKITIIYEFFIVIFGNVATFAQVKRRA